MNGGVLVKEAAKMILHVSPTVELSAAALSDIDWTLNLLKNLWFLLKMGITPWLLGYGS